MHSLIINDSLLLKHIRYFLELCLKMYKNQKKRLSRNIAYIEKLQISIRLSETRKLNYSNNYITVNNNAKFELFMCSCKMNTVTLR